jgi:hypothetical protein
MARPGHGMNNSPLCYVATTTAAEGEAVQRHATLGDALRAGSANEFVGSSRRTQRLAIGEKGTPQAECEVEWGHQSGRRADDGGDGIHQPHGGRQNPLIGVAATTPVARQTEVQPKCGQTIDLNPM